MKVLRLYADALGESRFETTTIPMVLKEFAPPAAPLCVSDPQPAQNYVILEHISLGLNRRDSQWFVNERVYPP